MEHLSATKAVLISWKYSHFMRAIWMRNGSQASISAPDMPHGERARGGLTHESGTPSHRSWSGTLFRRPDQRFNNSKAHFAQDGPHQPPRRHPELHVPHPRRLSLGAARSQRAMAADSLLDAVVWHLGELGCDVIGRRLGYRRALTDRFRGTHRYASARKDRFDHARECRDHRFDRRSDHLHRAGALAWKSYGELV